MTKAQGSGLSTDFIFPAMCVTFGLPRPESEFRFHVQRKWRFDYCWPDLKVAVEIEGGVWTQGRHTRPVGFLNEVEIEYHGS